jgi:hypothetical protein
METGAVANAPLRSVEPRQIMVLTASLIRIDGKRYQIAGVRAPRILRSQCFYEKSRGRAGQRLLRSLLRTGPIEIAPTGATNMRGDPFVRLLVHHKDIRGKLLARGAVVPLKGNERGNPWCVRP